MSEPEHKDPLLRRLIQRVATPGLLNRGSLQQQAERPRRTAVSHDVADHLQQRSQPFADARGGSLVLQRLPRSVDETVMSPMSPPSTPTSVSQEANPLRAHGDPHGRSAIAVGNAPSNFGLNSHAGVVATAGITPTVQRAALAAVASNASNSNAITERLVARSAPSLVLADLSVQRRSNLSAAAAFASAVQSRYESAPSKVPSIAAGAANPVSIAHAPTSAGMVMRQLDSPSPVRAPHSSSANPESAPRQSIAPVVVERKSNPHQDSPLVLQRVMKDPDSQAASISFPVARHKSFPLATDETPARKHAATSAHPTVVDTAADLDIERIADEVGRRLAQRLEIERERRGLRRWR